MSLVETIESFMVALEMADFERAAQHLADDFVFSGWGLPQPLPAGRYLALMSELKTAIRDWQFNLAAEQEQHGFVTATTRISGTNTQDLSLTVLGLSALPASDYLIVLPQERLEFYFSADKISKIKVEDLAGGGINGLLQQIGGEAEPQIV